MAWWRTIRFWLRARLRGGSLRAEIDEELEDHLRRRAEELKAEGLPGREASRAARARFGDVEAARRACRELYLVDGKEGDGMIQETARDVRFTVQALRRQPAFGAAVILTLGLGIGANSAIFGVLDGVLLQPLPYEEPAELVRLWQADRVNGTRFENFSAPDFFDARERSPVFASAAAVESRSLTLAGPEGDPERITAVAASRELLEVLGVRPALGRWFTAEEDLPDGEKVAVLGHRLWTSRFAGDPSVAGRSVRLDGVAHRVVGVAGPDLEFPRPGVPL